MEYDFIKLADGLLLCPYYRLNKTHTQENFIIRALIYNYTRYNGTEINYVVPVSGVSRFFELNNLNKLLTPPTFNLQKIEMMPF